MDEMRDKLIAVARLANLYDEQATQRNDEKTAKEFRALSGLIQDCIALAEREVPSGPEAFSLPEQRDLTEAEHKALRKFYAKAYKPVAAPPAPALTHEYLCEYERGDAWVTGNQPEQPTVLMAQGPCGCKWQAAPASAVDGAEGMAWIAKHVDAPRTGQEPPLLNQRMWDLLRHQRMELRATELITDEEYTELAKDHAAVQRLEDYDKLRALQPAALTAEQIKELARILVLDLSAARHKSAMVQVATAERILREYAAAQPGKGKSSEPAVQVEGAGKESE